MEFKAFKMDGLGNDFVIIDQRNDHIELTNDQIKKITCGFPTFTAIPPKYSLLFLSIIL